MRIETALNYSSHCTSKLSPFEMLRTFSPISPIERYLKNEVKAGLERIRKRALKEEEERNTKRIKIEYVKDGEIMIRSKPRDKTEDKFRGPFRIVKMIHKNRLKIDEAGKEIIIYI